MRPLEGTSFCPWAKLGVRFQSGKEQREGEVGPGIYAIVLGGPLGWLTTGGNRGLSSRDNTRGSQRARVKVPSASRGSEGWPTRLESQLSPTLQWELGPPPSPL
jgi:hypothetical protein